MGNLNPYHFLFHTNRWINLYSQHKKERLDFRNLLLSLRAQIKKT